MKLQVTFLQIYLYFFCEEPKSYEVSSEFQIIRNDRFYISNKLVSHYYHSIYKEHFSMLSFLFLSICFLIRRQFQDLYLLNFHCSSIIEFLFLTIFFNIEWITIIISCCNWIYLRSLFDQCYFLMGQLWSALYLNK